MVSQRDFDAIVQADLDQKLIVQWTSNSINSPTTTSSTSSTFALETTGGVSYLIPEAGYVSRVWGIIENTHAHADGPIQLSLGVGTRTSPSSTSVVAHNLPDWAADDHTYLEVFVSSDMPFVAEDFLTLEWVVESSVTINGDLRANVWAELTIPTV